MTKSKTHTIKDHNISSAFGMVFALGLMQFGATSYAQQSPAPTYVAAVPLSRDTTAPVYDMAHTIQFALRSSSDLLIADRNLDRDAALADQAAGAGRPKLGSSGSYTHLDSPVRIAFGASPPIVVQPEDTEILNAEASLPIDLSGAIRASTQAAELQELADKFQRDRIFNARVLYAETSYFNLLRAEHQVDVAQSALQNATTQQDIAQKQFQGGVGQRIDYLRAQTQVAQAQQNLLSAQNSLRIQKNSFNDLLGRPLNASVEVADTAGVTTGLAVAAGNADTTTIEVPAGTFYTPPAQPAFGLDQALQAAQKSRPELLADQVNIQAANKQIFIARQGLSPTLSLKADGNYYPVTDFQNPRHSIGIFTATVTIPLYDGGVTRDRIREARDTAENEKTLFGSDQTDVEFQVRQAYANLTTAAQEISAANSALSEAVAARRLAQVRYTNGVGLYLEVTDAESALTQAETQQVNSVYDYLTAEAQYENAIGTPQVNPQI